ncbi:MAG: GNAT family N-acetyltransferase [Ruminococcaceae bacterium]|nr:GNAT family N-acetyltransferase [Oscillospiraceae bacterium]
MRIDNPKKEQFPALRALWREAFGDSEEFLNLFEKNAFSPDRCRCVTLDGQTVAALYWFGCICHGEKAAYLYAVATAKSQRGQGLCAALMRDTHEQLRSLGYTRTLLVPSTTSLFAFYGKLGYQAFGGIDEFSAAASTEGMELWRVGIDEYARRRRSLLPAGSVIQEKENLYFLQAQAELYATEDLLLAARREGECLLGIELLGKPAAAPRILRTLECREGRFRVPGNQKPFAMWLPLSHSNLAPPTYFGLAFD